MFIDKSTTYYILGKIKGMDFYFSFSFSCFLNKNVRCMFNKDVYRLCRDAVSNAPANHRIFNKSC